MNKFDVIIVGAGPAGSIAARETAQAGLSVLLLEKRPEPGSPVRCAEGLGRATLETFVTPEPAWISRVINGARLVAPDGGFVDVTSHGDGYILERKIFDRRLVELAAEAGAEVRVKTRVTNLLSENDAVAGVETSGPWGVEKIKADIVIAADGVESLVGRMAGLDTGCTLDGADVCAQYLLSGVDLERNDFCHFYFGSDIAPGGYAWAFPKGENTANVGLGIKPDRKQDPGRTALRFLDEFVASRFPGAKPVSIFVGSVPVDGKRRDISCGGLLVAGDAAHQADPLTGGGITNAMAAGRLAASTAVEATATGDFSASYLRSYDKRWRRLLGRRFPHLARIRDEVIHFDDAVFNRLVDSLGRGGASSLIDIFKTALINKPSLLIDIGQLALYGWFGRKYESAKGRGNPESRT